MLVKNGKLVMNLREPDRILNILPVAKSVRVGGRHLVAVPHRTAEVRILRNLGMDAPSPIDYYYDWPIRPDWTPMAHQKATARFLVDNNRAYCLNDIGCVDSETECLTPTGWQKISEYSGGPIAQYWPEEKRIEFVDDPEYVKLPCDEMIRIKTKYGLDQMLSPEHRVLLSDKKNERLEVLSAAALKARQDAWLRGEKSSKLRGEIGYTQATIPVTFTHPTRSAIPLTDAELRVMCAVIADGHFPNRTNRCVIRIKKKRKKVRLRQILLSAGIDHREKESGAPTASGYAVFSFNAPRHDKVFDDFYWAASEHQRRVIADEVLQWDGCTINRQEFISTIKQSADFVQYVFASLGYTARITTTPINKHRKTPLYTVVIRDNGKPLQLCGVGVNGKRHAAMSTVPSTDGFKYCFIVPSTFLLFRRNGCVFASGNTAKTLSALWGYDFLRQEGRVKKLLVIAPLSTLEQTWAREVFSHFPHLTYVVLHGTREKRRELLQLDAHVYIINHDGVKVILNDLIRKRFDIIILDELAQVGRNATTKRWKAYKEVISITPIVWGLTGTPMPNAPTDAWAQCRLITPSTVPKSFRQFRSDTMFQLSEYKWLPRKDAVEHVYKVMQPGIRFERDECLDLPPVMYETRDTQLTTEQQRMYRDMVRELQTELKGKEITAMNEAVKLSKLVQICAGAAITDEQGTVVVPAKHRLRVLLEVIEEAPAKVIVFFPFRASLNFVSSFLSKAYTVEVIHGGVPKGRRNDIFQRFQHEKDPRILVAHPAAMSHGLTLTAASVVCWFAPTTSADIYNQANGRISRIGQTKSQLIVHLQGSSIESMIYKRLETKTAMQGTLLELFAKGI